MKQIRLPQTVSSAAPIALLIAMGFGIVAFHMVYAAMGYPHYRDQHLGTALTYARVGVDLLKPVIVGFNANNTPTPQEFPFWQAAASLPLCWFGGWFGWANIVSLLLFSTALYPAWRLGATLGGTLVGWWTIALLLCQPLVWIYAGAGAADGTALASSIWFFYCGCRSLEGRRRAPWAIATAATGALAVTLKLPFMMAAGIGLGIILLARHRRDLGCWLAMGVSAAFSVFIFIVWTRYTDSCIAQAEFGFVDLRTSHNPAMVSWYFGDWDYRLNPANWIKGAWRALNAIFGSFAVVAGPIAILGMRRGSLIALAWLAGCLIVTAIFSHLVLHHSHYYLMYSPSVALLLAPTFSKGWALLQNLWAWPKALLTTSLIAVSLLSVGQGLVGLEAVQTDVYQGNIVEKVREHTAPDDKLLIVQGGWGGNILFLSGRQGLSIWTAAMLDEGDNLRLLRGLGYNRLVLISESPLLAALQITNPGNANYKRQTYIQVLSENSRSWPTVFQDEDILIKELPQ
jgi:hypothetical protein